MATAYINLEDCKYMSYQHVAIIFLIWLYWNTLHIQEKHMM